MGFSLMAAVANYTGIGGSAKLLLMILANFVNRETGVAWPSLATLAKATGLSRSQVIRLLGRLEHEGLLSIERGGGRTQSSRYRVTIPQGPNGASGVNDGNGMIRSGPENKRKKIMVSL